MVGGVAALRGDALDLLVHRVLEDEALLRAGLDGRLELLAAALKARELRRLLQQLVHLVLELLVPDVLVLLALRGPATEVGENRREGVLIVLGGETAQEFLV